MSLTQLCEAHNYYNVLQKEKRSYNAMVFDAPAADKGAPVNQDLSRVPSPFPRPEKRKCKCDSRVYADADTLDKRRVICIQRVVYV